MEATCIHHWLCGPPGPVVTAKCKKCGSEREFKDDATKVGFTEGSYNKSYYISSSIGTVNVW